MKTVTLYRARDGELFVTQKECLKYEADDCVKFDPIPPYGEHLPLEEKTLGWMLNGDGSCYYATAKKMSRVHAHDAPHPKWATHLIYFGK